MRHVEAAGLSPQVEVNPTVICKAYAEVQVPEGPHELSDVRPSPKASFNFGPHDLRSEGQF